MTIFKLKEDETLQPGEIIRDEDTGIIYCNNVNDFINFIQEQYADENSD